MIDLALLIVAVGFVVWSLWNFHGGPALPGNYIVLSGKYESHSRFLGLFDLLRIATGAIVRSDEPTIFVSSDKHLPLWSCPFCLSFWVQFPFVALLYYFNDYSDFTKILLPFALPIGYGLVALSLQAAIKKLGDH